MSAIVWSRPPSKLADDFLAYGERVQRALAAVADLIAALLESDAKANASWTDRTTQARNGLTGIALVADDLVTIYLVHMADHGKWLEIAHGAPYRIIIPTITANYGRIMQMIASVIKGGA